MINFVRSLVVITFALASTALLANRVAANSGEEAATVSFANDIQPIFNLHCVFCHLTGATQGELNLEPGLAYEALVEVRSSQVDLMRVVPYEPERSYLVHKLHGTHRDVGGTGERMPLGGILRDELIALIVTWIEEGALDN